jgi:uncharacterized protein YjiS (DUF1127 family)
MSLTMNHTHPASGATLNLPAVPVAHRSGATQSLFARAIAVLQAWVRRSRGRDDLAELDEHLLRDIGLTRSQVENERSKFFWQE